MAAIFGKRKFFENCQEYISQIACGSKISTKSLSRTVKEIEVNLCFVIFGENSKWPPFLGRGKFFENCQEYISERYPVARKFRRNRSISHG